MDKQEQKKILIDMMKSDEELGLYDDIEINRIELVCKDCSDSLEDCTCTQDTIEFLKEEPNIISDWLEQNRNPEIDKQVEKELEYLSKQEIKLEEIFNDDKKENIKKFIDEIKNPSEPNQALKDAAERLKGKELFKESNDRARKILSEIKSLPIQERYEKYSERFDNKDNEIVEGIFNPDNWGRRLVKEKPKQETIEDAFEKYSEYLEDFENKNTYESGFKDGAKWQQERSYSEEEVIAFGEFIFKNTLLTHAKGVKNLFEQFKKK
jgi:hypothetical protein